ncbi:MAG: DUF3566 domain-containing protein [Chloroflexia bacterium]
MSYGQPPPGNTGGYQPPPGGYQPPPQGGYQPQAIYNPGAGASAPALGRHTRAIRHVDVFSAFKVGAVSSALVWAIIGILFVIIFGVCGLGALNSVNPYTGQSSGGLGAIGLIGSIIFYVIGIFLYGIFGGIFGALYALIYNMTAGFTGGIQLDVE